MNPIEERLNRLETRVTHYRNFNLLLCLLLVIVVTAAAKESVSPFQAKLARQSVAIPQGDVGISDLPDRNIPEALHPDANFAGKVPAQVEGTIRTRRLEIVNGNGQTVVLLTYSTSGGGLIYVNSAEDKNLVYIGSSAARGDGLVNINSTVEKNLISLGSHSETGDGRISIRNRNEERLIRLNTNENSGWIRIEKTGNENLAFLGANTFGNGGLWLYNESGKRLVAMETGEISGRLWLSNSSDKTVAYLGTDVGGEGLLRINSKKGTELITAGSNTADDGFIRVSNRYGILGAGLAAGNEQGYVGIQNSQEMLLAEMTATPTGDGLVRTLSTQGITTWTSASVQVTTGSKSLKGDMDNDGDIDGDDFLIFSENFGKKK